MEEKEGCSFVKVTGVRLSINYTAVMPPKQQLK